MNATRCRAAVIALLAWQASCGPRSDLTCRYGDADGLAWCIDGYNRSDADVIATCEFEVDQGPCPVGGIARCISAPGVMHFYAPAYDLDAASFTCGTGEGSRLEVP